MENSSYRESRSTNDVRDNLRLNKYNELYDSNLVCEMNRDGRYPWRCENCRKFQHPDHDQLRSCYYQFVGSDGPNFCGYNCLQKYRDRNDAFRFGNEETEKNRQTARNIANRKRKWKIPNKKSVESILENGTEKQQKNVLDALHAVISE